MLVAVDNVDTIGRKKAPDALTCVTGLVNFDPESGEVVYDDTQQKACGFGTTKCYKRTIFGRIGNWPGIPYGGI